LQIWDIARWAMMLHPGTDFAFIGQQGLANNYENTRNSDNAIDAGLHRRLLTDSGLC